MTKRLSFYDSQHIQKVLAQQEVIASIFNRFILSISPYLQQWSDKGSNSVWVRNQIVEKVVDRELDKFQSMLLSNIATFNIDAWKRSDMKNEDFIKEYIKGMAISAAKKQELFANNQDAVFQLRKGFDARGNDLSPMVWNLADQTKTQLEFYLQTGLSVGRNANQISQDIRQLLNEPDRRFRRIRNDKGQLVMSQPMKDYHPGQGVYRSSKMNALRLSATTTNTAYRTADYERWNQQEFIIGITIQRSGNNKGPCKICDAMCGDYPKTFKFTGFHPFCICFATPKVLEPEDLAGYLLNDTIPQGKVITNIPPTAYEFVDINKDGLQSAYWYKDNFNKDGLLRHEYSLKPREPIATYGNKQSKDNYVPDIEYEKRLLVDKKADKNELQDNVRAAKSLLNSFKEMEVKIREHILEVNCKNPEYEINGLIADRKGIESENGIASAFRKGKKQGCQAIVLDLDLHLGDKILKTRKLSSELFGRHTDFENGLIQECYFVYKNKAVMIDGSFFVGKSKREVLETIQNKLNKIAE